jgi:hypothetical protein
MLPTPFDRGKRSRSRFVTLLAAGLLGAALCGPARADDPKKQAPNLPDTPAGKQFAAWLKAHNSGDREALGRFVTATYAKSALKRDAVERRLAALRMIYDDNRELVLKKVERSADHEVEALVQSPLTESWLLVGLKLEAEAPHGITEVSIRFTEPPKEASPGGKLSDAEIAQRLEAYLDKMAAADLFSGAVVVARDGKALFGKA